MGLSVEEPLKITFSSCYLNYSEPNVQFFLYYLAECLFVARRKTCSIEICTAFLNYNKICLSTIVDTFVLGENECTVLIKWKEKTGSWVFTAISSDIRVQETGIYTVLVIQALF